MSQNWPDWSPDPQPPPPPGGVGTQTPPPDWGAPPPSGSGRGWLLAAVIGAVVVGLGLVVVAAVLVARSSDPAPVVGPSVEADEFSPPAPPPVADDDPLAATTAELLSAIDASELAMITFQIEYQDGIDQDGLLVDGGERLVLAAADKGIAELDVQRERMAAIEQVTGEAVTDGHLAIRDSYVLHLIAWRDWMAAVRDDPSLLAFDNEASDPFSVDIADTADVFVVELQRGLPEDTPADLQEYADFILERGFSTSVEDGGELV